MDNKNEILIYEDKDGLTRVDVKFIDEDVWLTKYQLADIYKTTRQNMNNILIIFMKIMNYLIQPARNSCRFKKKAIEK